MDREAFMDFYSDFSDEDPEYIHEYLAEEGIDIDGLQAKLLELIAMRKAELKKAEGRKFKANYYAGLREKAETYFGKSDGSGEGAPAVAYRKHEGAPEEDEKENAEDMKKLEIIKRAKEASSGKDKKV